jgi:hypothetical protein
MCNGFKKEIENDRTIQSTHAIPAKKGYALASNFLSNVLLGKYACFEACPVLLSDVHAMDICRGF